MARTKIPERIEASCGNVFADLRLPDAVALDARVRLAVVINRLLLARRLTQDATGVALSINQPTVSALKYYRLDGFSVGRLITFLTALGSDVEIRIRPHPASKRAGRIVVEAA